jgi:archaetidylinositol phosphate synthase
LSGSWTHRLVRPLVRPLIRLHVRPNHITGLHLVIGLVSLAAIAFGSDQARFWGGVAWLFSCLLDRLDGELARIGNMTSAWGHRFDYLTDMWLSALFFLALGLSVHGAHHGLATGFGALAGLTQLLNGQVAERFDRLSGDDGKVLASRWGFDADDALYILGPLGWLPTPWRLVVTLLAGVGTAAFLLLFVVRLRRLRARLAAGLHAPI